MLHRRPGPLQTASAQVALACAIPLISGAIFSFNIFTLSIESYSVEHNLPVLHGLWAPSLSAIFYLSSLFMIPVGYFLSRTTSRAYAMRTMMSVGTACFLLFSGAGLGVYIGSPLLIIVSVGTVAIPSSVLSVIHVDHLAIWQPRAFGRAVGMSTVTFGTSTIVWSSVFHLLLENFSLPVAMAIVAVMCTVIMLTITLMLRFPNEDVLHMAQLSTGRNASGATSASYSATTAAESIDALSRPTSSTQLLSQQFHQSYQQNYEQQQQRLQQQLLLEQRQRQQQQAAPSESVSSVASSNQAIVVDPDADTLDIGTLLRAREFWNFVLVVMAFAATFPLMPYFFTLGAEHGASELTSLRWYQAGTGISVLFNLTSATLSDVARTKRGRWRMGSRNVLLVTMTLQTVMFVLLGLLDDSDRFVLWVSIVTMQRLFQLSGYSMAAMLAGDVFGKQNVGIVVGFGRGLALGVGEVAATGMMMFVEWVAGESQKASVEHLKSYYVFSGVWTAMGLLALGSLRRFRPKLIDYL